MNVIINYHSGNPASIRNMLKKVGYDSIITENIDLIRSAKKIIIPGVGKFDYGMTMLKELGMIDVLNYKALIEKAPILGICLGYQLMTLSSEEGRMKGLGWLEAETIRFRNNGSDFKIPHMGWNNVRMVERSSLFKGTIKENRFYFVHSYYVKAFNVCEEIGATNYIHQFSAAMQRENLFGVQFHPEKSHGYGMQVLSNFMEL